MRAKSLIWVGLCNAGNAVAGMIGLANRFDSSPEGSQDEQWVQLSPYGDFPHAKGIQRIDRVAAEAMVNNFNRLSSRVTRMFGGLPVFVGHPDYAPKEFTDTKAYGWIHGMEAREDGLYGKVKWGPAGKELLANAHYKYCSPHWNAPQPTEQEQGRKIYRPVELVSLGLTNNPNIPVNPLINSSTEGPQGATETDREDMKELIIQLFGLANTASDEEIKTKLTAAAAAMTALANEKAALATAQSEKAAAETALANERAAHNTTKTTLTSTQASLANERKERVVAMVDGAIASGKVALANRAQWIADLEADFAGKSVALANTNAGLNTQSQTQNGGSRRESIVNTAQEFTDKVQGLVNERMKRTGEDYTTAWNGVKAEHAALFEKVTAGK